MTQKHAIVREPGSNFPKCISSHPLRNSADISLARTQHKNYCNTLSELGLEVIYLPRDDVHPDSCFVEDNAIIHDNKAFIARMGAKSRRGEEFAVEEFLNDYMPTKRALQPATIDGGDVIHLSDRLISGITTRTNFEGVNQMKKWFNVTIDTCIDSTIVHLKSYVTYIRNNFMLVTKSYAKHPISSDFNILVVQEQESYAANALTIDDVVLMPSGYPKAQTLVKEAGFEVISLDMSEFQKCEGALTCLSLLF
ncbi:MAG: dimethylarginine dimethylaminohydrolase family protein [Candidatus Hodarchaeales archaeon]